MQKDWIARFGFAPAAGCLVAALLTVPVLAPAQGRRCPQDDPNVVAVDVTVDVAAGTVSVTPPSVEVYMADLPNHPHRACWAIEGLSGDHILVFEDKDPDSPNYFPGLKRRVSSQSPFASSGDPARAGTWRYTVVVRNSDGAVVAELDPEVIVRGGGGG